LALQIRLARPRRLNEAGIATVKHGVVSLLDMRQASRLAAPLQDIFERPAPEFGGQPGFI